jgi:hypothetical protein
MLTVAVAVLVLALAGCAPTPASGQSTAPATSPRPTATLASAPVPALPLTCARLFTVGAVQSHLHATVSAEVDETHTGGYLEDFAMLQAGGTECTWGGQDMTDSSYDTGVVLTILPDAATEFAARQMPTSGDMVTGTIGASSAYDCASGAWCYGDALAGSYWISFIVGDADSPDNGPTPATVEAILKPIAQAVSTAGGSVKPWAKPSEAFDGAALCTAVGAQGLVSSALGAAVTPQDTTAFDDIFGAAAHREGLIKCSWAAGPNDGIGIDVLPGGSWVYPRVAAAPPLWNLIGHPTAIDASGSDGALVGCGDHCEALFSIQKSLVQLFMNYLQDQATATGVTQKLVSGIAAP